MCLKPENQKIKQIQATLMELSYTFLLENKKYSLRMIFDQFDILIHR